jgi:hypothetical protein
MSSMEKDLVGTKERECRWVSDRRTGRLLGEVKMGWDSTTLTSKLASHMQMLVASHGGPRVRWRGSGDARRSCPCAVAARPTPRSDWCLPGVSHPSQHVNLHLQLHTVESPSLPLPLASSTHSLMHVSPDTARYALLKWPAGGSPSQSWKSEKTND